jgi:hypothetical protein
MNEGWTLTAATISGLLCIPRVFSLSAVLHIEQSVMSYLIGVLVVVWLCNDPFDEVIIKI